MNNGIKPLNDLLDTLNIITLLTNIPTAAYDADKCTDFEVSTAKEGEVISGFDGKEHKLSNNDIVVRTNGNIICLAGILGAKEYGVTNDTKNIYIEMANFDFVKIRNTAAKFGIQTDAARRLSKHMPTYVTMVAASLIKDFFPGNFIGYNIDCKPEPIKCIKMDVDYINEILGEKFKAAEIKKYLKLLGFTSKGSDIIPPPFRMDVESSQDIAEDLLKPMNVDSIKENPLPTDGVTINKYTEYYFINNL
jgi:phenylalanyl-tRNA synthetase beta chain